jgi:hypothetical protein
MKLLAPLLSIVMARPRRVVGFHAGFGQQNEWKMLSVIGRRTLRSLPVLRGTARYPAHLQRLCRDLYP